MVPESVNADKNITLSFRNHLLIDEIVCTIVYQIMVDNQGIMIMPDLIREIIESHGKVEQIINGVGAKIY